MRNRDALILLVCVAACRGTERTGSAGSGSDRAGSAEPRAEPAGRTELGSRMSKVASNRSALWRDDGAFVYFAFEPNIDDNELLRDYLIVDTRSHAMLTVRRASQIAFAPDHAHLVTVEAGQLVVYDLATANRVGAVASIASAFTFAPDGRLAWAELTGEGYRVHMRRLPVGPEVILDGPPGPRTLPAATETVAISFDVPGHVVAFTGWQGYINETEEPLAKDVLVAWRDEQPKPIVTIELGEASPSISEDGITYTFGDDDGRGVLRHLDLSVVAPRATEFYRDRVCGRAELDFSSVRRCSANRYLVRSRRAICIWDTSTGRVVTRIPRDNDYNCEEDLAWIADLHIGVPTRFYSTRTGKRVRRPDDANEYLRYGFDDENGYGPALPPWGPVISDAVTQALVAAGADERPVFESPPGGLIAVGVDRTATLWSAAGAVVWRAPEQSRAAAIGFSRAGELVVVGGAGEIWRVDLASRTMRTAALTDCKLNVADPILVLEDGRAVVPCGRAGGRAVVVEGTAQPLIEPIPEWEVTIGETATAATLTMHTQRGTHAWSVLDGVLRWRHDVSRPLAVTGDGSRFAFIGWDDSARRDRLSVRDADNRELASVVLTDARTNRPAPRVALSPDGARVAVSAERIQIFDVTTATLVDEFDGTGWSVGTAAPLAWDPTGVPRVAVWRAAPTGLVIRDVVLRRDVEVRASPAFPVDREDHALVWSRDGARIALFKNRSVVLWEDGSRSGSRAPSIFGFRGAAGVEIRSDGRAVLLGDPAAAGRLVWCRQGARVTHGPCPLVAKRD